MKKFFAVLIVFALIFAACSDDTLGNNNNGNNDNGNNNNGNNNNGNNDNGNNDNGNNDNGNNDNGNNGNNQNNSDVIGIWTASFTTTYSYTPGSIELDISSGYTWVLLITDYDGEMFSRNGTWTRSGNTLTLSSSSSGYGSATLSNGRLILTQTFSTSYQRPGTCTLTKGGSEEDNEPIGSTTLRIRNESFIGITDVIWNNVTFIESPNVIATGKNEIKPITAGSGYIYFKREGNPIPVRTNVQLFEEGVQNEFVFRNTTPITEVSNTGNNAVLEIFFSKPWIYLKRVNGTVTDIIDLYSEYNFGSVLKGENKDITFTIQNIGLANLVIESVDGKRVNLDENTSGYFTVTQQPLAASIAPESTTTFTIRFSPTTIGTSFTANVLIKSNSQNAEEFAFRVKGNGRDYVFGDTGPGGGMIFYVQGGNYKECSGELGQSTWTDAVTTASGHRGGNFTDWSLPTRAELSLMYQNLHKNNLGGFYNGYYWSSEKNGDSNAYFVNFSYGSNDWHYINNTYRVRAVRSFSSQ